MHIVVWLPAQGIVVWLFVEQARLILAQEESTDRVQKALLCFAGFLVLSVLLNILAFH